MVRYCYSVPVSNVQDCAGYLPALTPFAPLCIPVVCLVASCGERGQVPLFCPCFGRPGLRKVFSNPKVATVRPTHFSEP